MHGFGFMLCARTACACRHGAAVVFGEDSVRVPILMYHSILKDSARQGKYVISPAVLAADLDAFAGEGIPP